MAIISKLLSEEPSHLVWWICGLSFKQLLNQLCSRMIVMQWFRSMNPNSKGTYILYNPYTWWSLLKGFYWFTPCPFGRSVSNQEYKLSCCSWVIINFLPETAKRRHVDDMACLFCNETESVTHLFFDCCVASITWKLAAQILRCDLVLILNQ